MSKRGLKESYVDTNGNSNQTHSNGRTNNY